MVLEFVKRILSSSNRISFSQKQEFQSLPSLMESLNIRFFIQSTLMVADRAKDFETLGRIHDQINSRCMELMSSGGSAEDLILILRHLRERIIHRIIALSHREMRRIFRRSPSKYAWFLAGSEGRGEPSFFTDQDNLIVFAEGDKEEVRGYFKILSEKINDRLSQVGFEACKGGVMAKNDEWRGSLKDWEERLQIGFSSLGKDLSENLKTLMFLSVLLDARFFVGDRQLSEDFLSICR